MKSHTFWTQRAEPPLSGHIAHAAPHSKMESSATQRVPQRWKPGAQTKSQPPSVQLAVAFAGGWQVHADEPPEAPPA